MAIRDEKIIAVGTEKEIRIAAVKGFKVVDLGGAFVMPGFNDAHVHLSLAGQDLAGVQLVDVPSIAEKLARLNSWRTVRLEPTQEPCWSHIPMNPGTSAC